ncbi:hypothetical protein EMCG_04234 [[Emmonsia] crescens]|uniref:Uncharacterized protein n=1 Tax=[Emmonsia] crescens TaxID=73230 RepID=A0A0G2HSX0_9EURO|nr:hypothetical protein EMCG_04234 [Emmonsia crescens UAMH 3008]
MLVDAGNPTDRDELRYLAEIFLINPQNRMINSISSEGESESERGSLIKESEASRLITITSELEQQLLQWYDSVPEKRKDQANARRRADYP